MAIQIQIQIRTGHPCCGKAHPYSTAAAGRNRSQVGNQLPPLPRKVSRNLIQGSFGRVPRTLILGVGAVRGPVSPEHLRPATAPIANNSDGRPGYGFVRHCSSVKNCSSTQNRPCLSNRELDIGQEMGKAARSFKRLARLGAQVADFRNQSVDPLDLGSGCCGISTCFQAHQRHGIRSFKVT